MANEITVTSSLNLRRGSQQYQSQPAAFTATWSGSKGPTPGNILVSTFGTDIDLTQLTTPGMCRIQNLDTANTIIVGIYNTDQLEFYPFMELLPGESYVFRLARHLNQEYANTGTGTTGELNKFHAIAENADSQLLVEAFDK